MVDLICKPVAHIASPYRRIGRWGNLCGAPPDQINTYDGLDEAYKAALEGWEVFEKRVVCRDCLATALIALGYPGGLPVP